MSIKTPSKGNSPQEIMVPIFQWLLDHGLSYKLSLAIHPMVINLQSAASKNCGIAALINALERGEQAKPHVSEQTDARPEKL